eukprot:TRINITY_DN8335_c0_g1_i1.p3 TRINITY_DN8335_c0_g1~~TRINITY_DN8335_c0_g1_i1.p3  ORF type:complete len:113 (+),score=7.88 TRINITY_DN8335_c0_g1_i1:20-358(+)
MLPPPRRPPRPVLLIYDLPRERQDIIFAPSFSSVPFLSRTSPAGAFSPTKEKPVHFFNFLNEDLKLVRSGGPVSGVKNEKDMRGDAVQLCTVFSSDVGIKNFGIAQPRNRVG